MRLLKLSGQTSYSVALLVSLCVGVVACGGKSTKKGGGSSDDDPGPNDEKDGPNTSNVFVEQIQASTTNLELDLLFVIDNSQQMAEKQALLAEALPRFIRRLTSPDCVSEAGERTANVDGCPVGSTPEFPAFADLHLGVISSSLGGGGSPACSRADTEFNGDDRGHLLPRIRTELDDSTGTGFLSWTAGGNTDGLSSNFVNHVQGAGEAGCGFEATLESWYRFLIDPQPPVELVVDGSSKAVVATDTNGSPLIDGELLSQRESFLRPESTVAIVMLTDENDCSMMMGGTYYNNAGFGYLTGMFDFDMPIATSACESNPNDACCFSCLQKSSPPDGCSAAECDGAPVLSDSEDRANARCFNQKKRFGVDLLYPTERYVDALTRPTIIDARDGREVSNPLLRGAGSSNAGRFRDPGRVHIMGIVGVPWQDLATSGSLGDPATMAYLSPSQLYGKDVTVNGTEYDRWDVVLGNPRLASSSKRCEGAGEVECGQVASPPLDPFMIESIAARPVGLGNPLSGDLIVNYDSTDPQANKINGHESNHMVVDPGTYADGDPANDQLQNACIFPLQTPKLGCTNADLSCDCRDEPLRNRATCQPTEGGAASTSQFFGKATPGTRILQVLRDVGANGYPASICPKVTTGDIDAPAYGYNPAMDSLINGIAQGSAVRCLPRELNVDSEGMISCALVEASIDALSCNADGRQPASPEIHSAIEKQLRATGRCDGTSGIPCADYSMCELKQLTDNAREECLNRSGDPDSFSNAGYCYIDPAKQDSSGVYIAGGGVDGTNGLVADCAPTERRLLRFVGENTPAVNSVTFIACTADAATSDDPQPF